MQKLTNDIILAAIRGYEVEKQRIEGEISNLHAMLTGTPDESDWTETAPSRRRLSAAVRRKMASAQRGRWAAVRGQGAVAAPAKPKKSRRKLSAAGKAAISLATKKRWAAYRAAKAAMK
jgi:hypothetical protein